jgi:hypothetical protein
MIRGNSTQCCHYNSTKLEICHPVPHVIDSCVPPHVSEIPMTNLQLCKIIMTNLQIPKQGNHHRLQAEEGAEDSDSGHTNSMKEGVVY